MNRSLKTLNCIVIDDESLGEILEKALMWYISRVKVCWTFSILSIILVDLKKLKGGYQWLKEKITASSTLNVLKHGCRYIHASHSEHSAQWWRLWLKKRYPLRSLPRSETGVLQRLRKPNLVAQSTEVEDQVIQVRPTGLTAVFRMLLRIILHLCKFWPQPSTNSTWMLKNWTKTYHTTVSRASTNCSLRWHPKEWIRQFRCSFVLTSCWNAVNFRFRKNSTKPLRIRSCMNVLLSPYFERSWLTKPVKSSVMLNVHSRLLRAVQSWQDDWIVTTTAPIITTGKTEALNVTIMVSTGSRWLEPANEVVFEADIISLGSNFPFAWVYRRRTLAHHPSEYWPATGKCRPTLQLGDEPATSYPDKGPSWIYSR